MLRTLCLLLCLAFLFTTAVSASCDESIAFVGEVEDIVSVVINRDYNWKKASTGNGVCWTYGPFEIGNFKITLATLDKVHITTGITDHTEGLMYIYEYMVDESDAIKDSVELVETIDLNSFETPTINPQYVGDVAEIWWDMRAYYNTSSAQKDRYWRIYNPRHSIEQVNFFAYVEDPIHECSLEYLDCIGEMLSLESAVENYYGMTVPHAIISLVEITLSSIIMALADASLSTDQAENILEVFHLRDTADEYYNFILDMDGQI